MWPSYWQAFNPTVRWQEAAVCGTLSESPTVMGGPVIDEQLLNDVRSQIWNRAWGITARGIGHQFDASTQLIKSRPTRRIPWHYSMWRNTVGCFNADTF
jgi:hypothetical protein